VRLKVKDYKKNPKFRKLIRKTAYEPIIKDNKKLDLLLDFLAKKLVNTSLNKGKRYEH